MYFGFNSKEDFTISFHRCDTFTMFFWELQTAVTKIFKRTMKNNNNGCNFPADTVLHMRQGSEREIRQLQEY